MMKSDAMMGPLKYGTKVLVMQIARTVMIDA